MKKIHLVLTDIEGQSASMSVEVADSVTAQTVAAFINTQSAAQVTQASEIVTPIL